MSEIRIERKKLPCGTIFPLAHSLHCTKDWYTHSRHYHIRYTVGSLLEKFCHDVQNGPHLQPHEGKRFSSNATNVDYDAKLDIKSTDVYWRTTLSEHFSMLRSSIRFQNIV